MKTLTLVLTAALLGTLALSGACGGDDDEDTPTQRPTATAIVEPTLQGDDDEAQIRYTIETFVYRLNQQDFDGVCELYTESVLDAVPCETIKANVVGNVGMSGGESVKARMPGINSVEIDGDTAEVDYTLCLDIGAGETCSSYLVLMAQEDDTWKIDG